MPPQRKSTPRRAVRQHLNLVAALNELACQRELRQRVAAERQQSLKDTHSNPF
jgi:hypothetical protein